MLRIFGRRAATICVLPLLLYSDRAMKGVMCENDSMDDMDDMSDFSNFAGMGDLGGMGSSGAGISGATIPIEEKELHSGDMTEEESVEIVNRAEKHEFQTELTRLMDIIINSLYKEKEVFLRELISNAADALEKARFLSLTNPEITVQDWSVKVECDPEKRTLTISDNGIGMTKDELINNLGVVAKSGTTNFLEAYSHGQSTEVNLIGQFGVGFYSAFLVADEVMVISRAAGHPQHIWMSSADKTFKVALDPRGNTLDHGTRVQLKIKEDSTSFLKVSKLKEHIVKFSQFIPFPIYLKVEKTEMVEEPSENIPGEEEKPASKVERKTLVWEQLNMTKAIWLRPKEQITDQEYQDFYKAIAKESQAPAAWLHFTAEGEMEFRAIIFLPSRAPFDMFQNYFAKSQSIKLYVRSILVADVIEDILPHYLNFIRGVVDSNDISLNVSRDSVQQSRILKVITNKLTKKALELMRTLMKDSQREIADHEKAIEEETDEEKKKELKSKKVHDKYGQFYSQFARNLKLGCYEDDTNRSRILKLLKVHTTLSPHKLVSFEDFLSELPKDQKSIYYATGESVDAILKLPQMQYFKSKGVPVLLFTESMDEPCIQKVGDFDGRKFESIQKSDITLPESEEEKKNNKLIAIKFQPLIKAIETELKSNITKVETSSRLTHTPCIILATKYGYSAYMERIMKTQTFADPMNTRMMAAQRILQINPRHPIIQSMLKAVEEGKFNEIKDQVKDMYEAAMLASGFDLVDSTNLVRIVNDAIASKIGVQNQALVDIDLSGITLDEEKKSEEESSDDDMDDTDFDTLTEESDAENAEMDGSNNSETSNSSSNIKDEL